MCILRNNTISLDKSIFRRYTSSVGFSLFALAEELNG